MEGRPGGRTDGPVRDRLSDRLVHERLFRGGRRRPHVELLRLRAADDGDQGEQDDDQASGS
jgi:hypothetical protein